MHYNHGQTSKRAMDNDVYFKTHREGMAAHRDGKSQDENPHEPGTEKHDGWNDGWLDAEYSEEENYFA